MLWSSSSIQVETARNRAQQADQLRESAQIHEWLSKNGNLVEDLVPVEYMVVHPRRNKLSKLVTAFATIDEDGFLRGRSFYSVASRVAREKDYAAATKEGIQGAHALAERTALTRGIYTPRGRTTGEALVAEAIPTHFRRFYINERLEHLAALTVEADASDLSVPEKLTIRQQLDLGAQALEALYPRRHTNTRPAAE